MEDSNFPFAVFDGLSAGDHTLVINVTQCLNHTFIFDYITYSPSFANLASMPNLDFALSASGTTSTSASRSGAGAPTASQVSPTATSQVPQKSTGSNVTLVGAAVGGSVGGLLVLVFLTLWLWRRRTPKENLVRPFDDLRKGSGTFLVCIHFSIKFNLCYVS